MPPEFDLPSELIRRLDTVRPNRLIETCTDVLGEAYAIEQVEVLLLDIAERVLTPYNRPDRAPFPFEGVLQEVVTSRTVVSDGEGRWLAPLTFRGDALGVLRLTGGGEEVGRLARPLGQLLGAIAFGTSRQSDLFILTQRGDKLSLPATVQRDLLPSSEYADQVVEIAASLEPAFEVAGDLYDYATNDGRVEFGIFDGVGHGLAASVLGGLAVSSYRWARRTHDDLGAVYTIASDVIARQGREGEFVTAFVCRLDLQSGRVGMFNAGHPLPLIHRAATGEIETPEAPPALPLGLGDRAEVTVHQLEPGDTIFMYTDGVVEAASPRGERWGLGQLEAEIRRGLAGEHRLRWVNRNVLDRVMRFVAQDLNDDATLLSLRWDPR